jgi:DNA-binding CsgD family transcriptional regulator
MQGDAWPKAIAPSIAALGQPAFGAELSQLLRSAAPYDFTVIFGYRGAARPLDLHDDFPADKRRVFVSDYQEGPYLLDPFYLASVQPVPAGLYRMRDLAPDRFYQGEYFRNYYIQTGLAEEIGYFVDFPDSAMPDGAMIVVSLMRAERPFSAREFREFELLTPIVAVCCRRHWADLAPHRADPGADPVRPPPHPDVKHAFRTFGAGVLTAREREVVEYTLKGHSADAVGKILNIASGTVRIHRRNIYAKLRINSQVELFSSFIETLGGSDPRMD